MFPQLEQPESIVIVEDKDYSKYAKMLYNLIGSNDDSDDGEVGPVDGSVQATIFDERLFHDNLLPSEQKIVFVGEPKFASDYIDAIDAASKNRIDAHGIHIRVAGKHAAISVDGNPGNKEDYWEFLDFAASHGEKQKDLLAGLRAEVVPEEEEPEGQKSPIGVIGDFVGGVVRAAGDGINAAADQVSTLGHARAIEEQKFRFAIKLFYREKLRAFVEA